MMAQSSYQLQVKLQPYFTLKNLLLVLIALDFCRYIALYIDGSHPSDLEYSDLHLSMIGGVYILGFYGVYKCQRPLVLLYSVFSVGLIISSVVRHSGMYRPPRYASSIINVGFQMLVFAASLSYAQLRMPADGDCTRDEDATPCMKEKPKATV